MAKLSSKWRHLHFSVHKYSLYQYLFHKIVLIIYNKDVRQITKCIHLCLSAGINTNDHALKYEPQWFVRMRQCVNKLLLSLWTISRVIHQKHVFLTCHPKVADHNEDKFAPHTDTVSPNSCPAELIKLCYSEDVIHNSSLSTQEAAIINCPLADVLLSICHAQHESGLVRFPPECNRWLECVTITHKSQVVPGSLPTTPCNHILELFDEIT